ncbi:MAG: U32 family peptidase, partial [Oscillospiraceae bacterium]|nr:U32 family peptidase [Oscillospiraceae bacterium]
MSEILRKPEVLAPAGDMERLKAALLYGADAVYLAAQQFGMRTAPSNFSPEELKEGVALAHAQGVKVYLTCNTTPRNHEVSQLADFLRQVAAAGVDALIVADPGVLMTAKQVVPQMELHASTQVGVTNYLSAQSLYQMGVKRVVLARELSLEEIAEIRANTPADLELEAFVHGAMCMSVSGRCLLSQYMAGRDANRGACARPCRWSYRMEEERRPGEYYTIGQDEHGSYILNANDMCLSEHLDKLWKAGITSFKIEGRAKSAYYTAVVTNAYRCATGILLADPDHYALPDHVR